MTTKKTKEKSEELTWTRENCWNKISSSEHKELEKYCKKYITYLSASKTEWEAYDEAVKLIHKAGYKDFSNFMEKTENLAPGCKLYRGYQGKTLFVAQIGKRPITEGVHIIGGHTDAPRLDAKPIPLYEDSELVLLDTHYYGGIKKYQWVTMPLALHGIVYKENGEKVSINIGEKANEPVFVITDILPHLGREQAQKKMGEGITGEGLNVLFGTIPVKNDKDCKEKIKQNILNLLFKKYGIKEEDFISAELEIVPAGAARELGLDKSMILGYGHDDRICAFAGLQALLDLEEVPEYTSIVLLCDKEEVGSIGATGMDSTFFENSMAEILNMQLDNYSDLYLRRSMENSRMISADVGALHDPNYPTVSSPNNMARMNAGVIISKYLGSGGKGGSNDASAEFVALIRKIFNENKVTWQPAELGKVDAGGGGTIAKFLAKYGIDVIDSGVGLFSMHAPWETASKFDTYMAYKGFKAFFAYKSK